MLSHSVYSGVAWTVKRVRLQLYGLWVKAAEGLLCFSFLKCGRKSTLTRIDSCLHLPAFLY